MKQSLCIVSEYNKDYSLVDILQDNPIYELRTIFLTNTYDMPTFYIKDVAIVNNTHTECFDLSDAIYISNNCSKDVTKYIETSQKAKLINSNQNIKITHDLVDKYYAINVPVLGILGAYSNCGKNDVIVKLLQSINQKDENVAVISNYENNDLLGYYRFPMEEIYKCKTFNEKILIVNHFLYEVTQKSRCSILLFSIPGGVGNPFFHYDCESTILTYLISKACSIDYLMYILPGNMWEEKRLKTINSSISNVISKSIDYWILSSQIFDSPFFDNAYNTDTIPKISISKKTKEKIFYSCSIGNSAMIDSSTLGDNIMNDIVEKLCQQTDFYKIL